eukprot:1022028_1
MADIEEVCTAIGRYYASLGKEYDRLFSEFCDDNGIEEAEELEDELDQGWEDSLLSAEYYDFPFHAKPNDDETKKQFVFFLIKKCTNNPNITFCKLPQIDLFLPEETVQEIADTVYKKQMPCLELSGFPEPELMYFFAVGYANNLPLLTWLVDAYTMDRTKHYIHNKTTLHLDDWVLHNPFMKDLMDRDHDKATKLKTAMSAYDNRLLNMLQFESPIKINDDIQEIADCVSAMPHFLKSLLSNRSEERYPFCVDISFAVRDIKHEKIDKARSGDDDDMRLDLNPDCIGNIQQKLTASQRCYVSQDLPHHVFEDQDKSPIAFARFLMNCYNVFRDKLDVYKGQYDKKSFPKHKRFGIFVDRRESNNKHEVNEVTFFQQLSSCDTIPTGGLDEWYIQAVRDCIIPGIVEQKQSQRHNQRITAQEKVNGQLLTFSFNVEAEDQIKCYIIWNGQTS